MIPIIKFFLFDGIEHSPEDNPEDLFNDAFLVMEKIENVPVARYLKSRNTKCNNNPVYEEIIDTLKASGKTEEIIRCETTYLVHFDKEYNDECNVSPSGYVGDIE